MASNLRAMASALVAMVSNLLAIAMASKDYHPLDFIHFSSLFAASLHLTNPDAESLRFA